MKHPVALAPLCLALAGCSPATLQRLFDSPAQAAAATVQAPPTLDPTPPPPPPASARTVDQFDTTSAEDRAAALALPQPIGERSLGITIASLGSPTDPGIWLKTPLVATLTPGRVEYLGKSVNLELRPSGGPAGSGSQISLAAMRLLDAPLTGLPELTVFAR
jgi:hypothetical protein